MVGVPWLSEVLAPACSDQGRPHEENVVKPNVADQSVNLWRGF